MDYNDIVHERRSIRGYQQKPVPRELIEEIIDLAKRAPSSMIARRSSGKHSMPM